MKIEKFEDILAWKKAGRMTVEIYQELKTLKDFSFKDQLQRSSVSIMNNIAEGFERRGDKELRKFLFIAKGSCGELRSMLYLALEFKYIKKSSFDKFYQESLEISRMLSGFIKKLN